MMKSETASVNAPYNDFLAKYVERQNGINLVAYDKVTDADEAKLEAYIDTLSNTDISGFSDAEIMAYWFNLYNAKTVDVILDNYPVSSIRKIGFTGPWGKKLLTVNGEKLSLNNIEHDIVREDYDEPRVHFAFNCASIGCPDLKLTAWEAETLEEDLTQASIDFVPVRAVLRLIKTVTSQRPQSLNGTEKILVRMKLNWHNICRNLQRGLKRQRSKMRLKLMITTMIGH